MTSALTMPAQATLFSPSSIYSGPPPPYSYPSSTSSSVVGGNANGLSSGSGNYTSQAESRRTAGKDREQSSLQRHSLPSITEALTGGDQQQPLSISSLLSSTVTSQPKYSMISKGPTSPVARSYLDAGPKGPPDSFSQHTSSSYRPPPPPSNHSSGPNFSPRTASSRGESGFSAMNGFEPQPQLQPPRTAPSPSHYARPGASPIQHIQPNYPLPSPCQDKNPRPAPSVSNAPFGYNPYQSAPYSYSSSTPSVPSFQTPTLHQHPTWRSTAPEIERVDEIRKAIAAKETSPPRPAYAESVKRHLDIFELETSLNEVSCLYPYRFNDLLNARSLPKAVAVLSNFLVSLVPARTKRKDLARFQAHCRH